MASNRGKSKPALRDDTLAAPLTALSTDASLTARTHELEERLRRSEARYHTLADMSGQVSWATNADGVVVEDLPGWRAFTGQSFEQIQGNGWIEALHPDDRARALTLWHDAVHTRTLYETAYRLRRADGEYRDCLVRGAPVLDDGSVREWVGFCTDITERKRIEGMLATSEQEGWLRAQRMEAIFEALGDGISILDRHGRVELLNRAGQAIVGIEDEETSVRYYALSPAERAEETGMTDLAGQPIPDGNLPQQRVLRGETFSGARAMDVRLHSLDGHERICAIGGAPIYDASGEIIGGVVTYSDMTARRRLEEEREHMLNVVSHELKSPLTSMKALTQLTRRRLDREDHPETESLAKIERDVARMERLVNDLVDAGRLQTGHLALEIEPCDLALLCAQASEEQSRSSGRTVTLALPSSTVDVMADPTRLTQVLTNLLSNALKYSPADQPVTLSLTTENQRSRVEVRDQGPGIPRKARARLFERFYRVPGVEVQHGSGVGLGLGLYISKSLIERHDGQMGVDSTPGSGATFWFELPLAPGAQP